MSSSHWFEAEHVHTVYNEIAQDFSRTRHSRWPFVERFLAGLPAGSLVLDAGTGNGKYLGCRSVLNWDGKEGEGRPRGKGKGKEVEPDLPTPPSKAQLLPVGFDMSSGLLGIASGKGHEVVKGDCVDMSCWRRGAFNHCISIATIHHFATPSRRVESIKQMILCVLPPSPLTLSPISSSAPPPEEAQILIVVWSLEQDPALYGARSARRTTGGKKGAVPVSSLQAGLDEGVEKLRLGEEGEESEKEEQDVFVPWERQEPQVKKEKIPKNRRAPRPDSSAAPSSNPSAAQTGAATPPVTSSEHSTTPSPAANGDSSPAPKPSFNRYYHLYRRFELSSQCLAAADSLGMAFGCLDDYTLEVIPRDEGSEGEKVQEAEGWEAYVRVKEERWERENWVVEMGVGWRRKKEQ
ncbi:hypothetical protein JCM8547_006681 [Rhodosporidiobolus lusitaniae]